MDQPISFASSQDLGRYLQSLDSVRFAESDPDACIIHARVETMISLLFGQTVPIGEHQFLDSAGFLSSAVGLIDSLKTLDRKDRSKVEKIFPFRIGVRERYSTVDNLIAEKLGDISYKLSLWRGLGQVDNPEMQRRRRKTQKKFLKGKFRFEQDKLVPPEDKEAAENLRLVRDRFRAGEQGEMVTLYNKPTVFVAPQIGLLRAGLDEIVKWTEADLDRQVDFQQQVRNRGLDLKESIDPDLVPSAFELITALKDLRDAGISFDNRSHIRIEPKSKEIVPESDKFIGVLEIYDSLYNSSVAKAVGAHSEGVSISQDIQNNMYVKAALALSALAKNEVTSSGGKKRSEESNQVPTHWVQDTNFGLLEDSKAELLLARTPWEKVWHAYLSPEWHISVSKFNDALVEWDQLMMVPTSKIEDFQNISSKLDDAISHHADVVADIVKESGWEIFRDTRGKFVVNILPAVLGLTTKFGAQFVMGKVGIDPHAIEAEATADAIGLTINKATERALPAVVAWYTKGYLRRMFERIYNPTE